MKSQSLGQRTYRTLTPDMEHLQQFQKTWPGRVSRLSKHSAELRANELMGSLLVPHDRLIRAAVDLAPEFDVKIKRAFGLFDELIPASPRLTAEGRFGFIHMGRLQSDLAKRFGVHRASSGLGWSTMV